MALAKTSASKEPCCGGCCWAVDQAVFQKVSIREPGWSQEHPTAVAGMALLPKFPQQRRSAPAPRTAQDFASPPLDPAAAFGIPYPLPAIPSSVLSQHQEHPAPFRESLCNASFALIWAGFSQMLQSWEGLHRAQVCHGNVALIW